MQLSYHSFLSFFFFNDTATTEIYTLSLHDALPICLPGLRHSHDHGRGHQPRPDRSEEHTSELQSRLHLVCRLLLEKKKNNTITKKLNKIQREQYETKSEWKHILCFMKSNGHKLIRV